VIVMLPRVPEWQAVIVGLLEIGALVVPSSTQLRPKDVLYRASHSGAVAIVASHECVEAVEAVRAELTSAKHFSSGERTGPRVPAGRPHDALSRAARRRVAGRRRARAIPRSSTTPRAPPVRPKAVLHDHGYTWTQRYTSRFWHGVRPASGCGPRATPAGRRPPTA
jgi:acetyl-CoA synthetase